MVVEAAHDQAVGKRLPRARTLGALALANARYWPAVNPLVRRELRRWKDRARAIDDPELRALALAKLQTEGFNAEAATIAATIAPHPHRRHAVEAILPLELLFDYLDGLTERPLDDPLRDGERLYEPFVRAIELDGELQGTDLYALDLAHAAQSAIAKLPAHGAIADVARTCAQRSAQAQIRMHAASTLGTEQAQQWAEDHASRDGAALPWREYLAGAASSVLALHALIAAAADHRTTPEEAQRIDAAYLSICAVVTLLDGLVDHSRDAADGIFGYVHLYDDPTVLAPALTHAAHQAAADCVELRHSGHHLMMLAGVISYWGSQLGAREQPARPVLAQLREELGVLVFTPMLIMRAWRGAKLVSRAGRHGLSARADASGAKPR